MWARTMSICLCRCRLSVGEQGDAVSEGEDRSQVADGVRASASAILGRHLWTRGYFAASSGNVTDEVIMQYIATQGQEPSPTRISRLRSSLIGSFSRL